MVVDSFEFEQRKLLSELLDKEIRKMEVKCFFTSEENGKCPVLTVNVGEY